MIDLIRQYCLNEVKNDRTVEDIFTHLEQESLELYNEIYPSPLIQPDEGIFGESIDVILCAFDLIFKEKPDITNEEIEAYVLKKLQKWKNKYNMVP